MASKDEEYKTLRQELLEYQKHSRSVFVLGLATMLGAYGYILDKMLSRSTLTQNSISSYLNEVKSFSATLSLGELDFNTLKFIMVVPAVQLVGILISGSLVLYYVRNTNKQNWIGAYLALFHDSRYGSEDFGWHYWNRVYRRWITKGKPFRAEPVGLYRLAMIIWVVSFALFYVAKRSYPISAGYFPVDLKIVLGATFLLLIFGLCWVWMIGRTENVRAGLLPNWNVVKWRHENIPEDRRAVAREIFGSGFPVEQVRKTSREPYTTLTIVIFMIVAVVHLLRIVLRWDVIIGGSAIPMWVSYVGLVVAAGLAVMVWRESRDGKT